jgi:hypothetical protein
MKKERFFLAISVFIYLHLPLLPQEALRDLRGQQVDSKASNTFLFVVSKKRKEKQKKITFWIFLSQPKAETPFDRLLPKPFEVQIPSLFLFQKNFLFLFEICFS